MNPANIAGFLSGYLLFTAVLSTILILTNRISFTFKSIAITAVITATITALGALLKNKLRN
ncbi:MAG TPA: hypothetical protein VJB66_05080 [Candidatus Nanoarchaeia archaeon]|nr:hypothetical protein [Candidatus Nanoarchaeia archaeon]